MQIKSVGKEELSEYELEKIKEFNPEWFIYSYESGSYEGSGFSIWKKNDKFYYSDLGHCSCYGPLDELSSIAYDSIEDVKKFANEYNGGSAVIEAIKTL